MNIKKTRIIFAIYIVLLSVMLLFKFQLSFDYISDKINSIKMNRELGVWNINLIPFKTICSQLEMLRAIPVIAMKNILGNIMAFIPFGIFFPMSLKIPRYYKTFLAGTIYVLFIELTQFVFMLGAFDIDDIILNCFGITCGYVFYILIKQYNISHRFINYFS